MHCCQLLTPLSVLCCCTQPFKTVSEKRVRIAPTCTVVAYYRSWQCTSTDVLQRNSLSYMSGQSNCSLQDQPPPVSGVTCGCVRGGPDPSD